MVVRTLAVRGPPSSPPDVGPPPVHQHAHADEGEDGEERDGEGQRARVHPELAALAVLVDGRDGPRHLAWQQRVNTTNHSLTNSYY